MHEKNEFFEVLIIKIKIYNFKNNFIGPLK